MADFWDFQMVGVARIELATPAMSTKCWHIKTPKKRAFFQASLETQREQIAICNDPYRSFTATENLTPRSPLAVKRFFALFSTLFPHFRGLFASRHVRALRGCGENMGGVLW